MQKIGRPCKKPPSVKIRGPLYEEATLNTLRALVNVAERRRIRALPDDEYDPAGDIPTLKLYPPDDEF
jgi:hypothetical protein